MPDFIFRANIAHFENLLVTEKIATIRQLLAAEKAKLADSHATSEIGCGGVRLGKSAGEAMGKLTKPAMSLIGTWLTRAD